MGRIDNLTKAYLSDNARYADVINYYVFDGEQVVSSAELQNVDAEELIVLQDKSGDTQAVDRYRDLIRRGVVRTAKNITFVLFAIENQTDIHYAMPVREMLYDAVNYSNQVRWIARQHRAEKDHLDNAAFLSGIRRNDRIQPVITICIYWGSDAWDGPRSLHDMLDTKEDRLLRYVSDYKFNLIVPAEITDFARFRTDFGLTMEAIAAAADADRLERVLVERAELYDKDDTEMMTLIKELLGVTLEREESEEGTMTLAKGIQVLVERGEERGENAGEMRKLISQVRRKLEKGLDCAEIADVLEEDDEIIERIMQAIEELHSDADDKEVYLRLMELSL